MNAKTSILASFGVLALLLAGLAILQGTQPTVYTFTITIPAWLRYGGGVVGLAALALWLRAERPQWQPHLDAAADWLASDDMCGDDGVIGDPYQTVKLHPGDNRKG
jgi:hypothetical protein